MANRIFVLAVFALWLSSMAWLVTERVMPGMGDGHSPSIETFRDNQVVAWEVEWANNPVGKAASVRVAGVGGTVELHNRILLHDMPISDLAPTWMRMAVPSLGKMSFDVKSRIEVDSLGNFSSFHSKVSLNEMASVLRISGRVKDSYLNLTVSTGSLPYETSVYLPDSNSLNEVLFPGSELPYMYLGKHWQEEVYSPFRASGDQIELVKVEVVAEEKLFFAEELRRVFKVEYQGLLGSGISEKARLQAVSWVEPEGSILRRDVYLGSSHLRFNRLTEAESNAMGQKFFEDMITLETDSFNSEVASDQN
ncbi:hypothetical protein [Bythopirellula polymerisocia]|uniref:Uncharacterized protein n=1 Tax=Bythopirellula polymerisocia TaxID=2528003 RepID=A0A5C6CUV5_9BACT|nr:hypothetical protein [Bythopirellula polymerisocia]TWU27277.1 hypothetical protein Pla144_20490 [Bythopirellula polymerisocia]